MKKRNIVKVIASLLLLSIVLQGYSLLVSFRSITSLSSDLFEMFRPLGYPYFLSGVLLVVALAIYHFVGMESKARVVLPLFIVSVMMYKLLPKYTYYLPLQREIYHTANIMYVYNYHSVKIPGYPSMPESVGYAIFYATLGLILGLDGRTFLNFLSISTDLFHLFIIVLVSFAIIKQCERPFDRRDLLVLSIPVIFMLQINTTYRSGFGSLLLIYIIAILLMSRGDSSHSSRQVYMIMLIPFLVTASISYPGIVPILTISILIYMLISAFFVLLLKRRIDYIWIIYSALIANVTWFSWQLSRYPNLFNAIKMYVNSLLELITGRAEIEALTTRYAEYTYQYSVLLTLRTTYALALIGVTGLLAIIALFNILKGYGRKVGKALNAASFVTSFALLILIGGKGNFHFPAIYNMLSSSSAMLIATLLPYVNPRGSLKGNPSKKSRYVKKGLHVAVMLTFLTFTVLSPIALWPAFKNLMPLEAKEVCMFKATAAFAPDNATIGYLSLAGGVMGTALQYVFAERIDVRVFGIPYPTEKVPSYDLIIVTKNIIFIESKVRFQEPLSKRLDNFLLKLHEKGEFNVIFTLGYGYEVLCKRM